MDRCAECGFVYADLPRERIAEALRTVAAQYRARLGGDRVRTRPSPRTWSPLEYAAHVRDVLEAQHEQVALALRFDRPVFAPMEPDRRAAEERYHDQDPQRVVGEVERAADHLASLLEELSGPEWERVGTWRRPAPAEHDVAWIGRHAVHELVHHLLDVSRSIDPTAAPASG